MKAFLSIFILFICLFAQAKEIVINTQKDKVSLLLLTDNAVRVRYGEKSQLREMFYLGKFSDVNYDITESEQSAIVKTSKMTINIDKTNGKISYLNTEGIQIINELSHSLIPSQIHNEATNKAIVTFDSPQDEYLYGLGQFQDGQLNVRGLTRRLTQVNTQIAIPLILSNRGFALLWNNYGLTDFNPCSNSVEMNHVGEGKTSEVNVTTTEGGKREQRQEGQFEAQINIAEDGDYTILLDVGQSMARCHNLCIDGETVVDAHNLWLPPTTSFIKHLTKGNHKFTSTLTKNDNPTLYYGKVVETTTFSSPVADNIDYTVFVGNADEAIAAYRQVTGNSPMLPRWAFGYVHCRERFHSSDEILNTANTFRAKNLPLDIIVQDWQWWGKYGWNAMQFDEEFYPNPQMLVDSLHNIGCRLMLSVWSKIDENSEVGKKAKAKGYYIDGTSWIDFFNQEAADYYWDEFSQHLLKPYGIDCWWQDATEPENDDLQFRRIDNGKTLGERYRNVYPNLVSKTVYEGSRKDAPEHRTLILTRSGAPGIQRYGSFLWSGDVGNDWQTLKYQIIGGLGLMAAGHPWWTFDAGGFFRPFNQYSDTTYHERFLRWLQIATFLPMMRVHGYMTDTEFWNYGPDVEQIAKEQLELRYRLLPYIYSESYKVTQGGTMMRPLVMDFPNDKIALSLTDEYMFGQSLLVCPITEPNIKQKKIYLPKNEGGWYDFYNNKYYPESGEYVNVDIDIKKIPIFAKAGSIVPMLDSLQTTANYQREDVQFYIYTGKDTKYLFYDDEGTNYNYENGKFTIDELNWNESTQTYSMDKNYKVKIIKK